MKHGWPWKGILALTAFAVIIVFSGVAVTRSFLKPTLPPGPPQAGVVLSYGLWTPTFGNSCGGVAVVRLKDGDVVRAAALESADLRKGALVSVSKMQSSCPPAFYTVLQSNPSPTIKAGAARAVAM